MDLLFLLQHKAQLIEFNIIDPEKKVQLENLSSECDRIYALFNQLF